MTKADLLKMLTDDYKKKVRLPDDVDLRDFRDAVERETGLRVSEKRATRILNELVREEKFITLLVVERGKVLRVWREAPKKKERHAK